MELTQINPHCCLDIFYRVWKHWEFFFFIDYMSESDIIKSNKSQG